MIRHGSVMFCVARIWLQRDASESMEKAEFSTPLHGRTFHILNLDILRFRGNP
jgi:hypothetical protein